jgi:hypothetical protein
MVGRFRRVLRLRWIGALRGTQLQQAEARNGGTWLGSPDATTVFPPEMQENYVRLYTT